MNQKILTIQYLRAIAALLVIIFHFFSIRHSDNNFYTAPYFEFSKIGEFGVSIFFLISGAIMSHIIVKENSPEVFLKKRLLRIFPTYWECYIATIILWLLCRALLGIHVITHGSWGLNLSLMPFEYDAIGGNNKMTLPVAWTLYYEIMFYMVITAGLYCAKNMKNFLLVFGFVIFVIDNFFIVTHWQLSIFYEFLAGFFLMQFIKDKKIRNFAIWAIFVFFAHATPNNPLIDQGINKSGLVGYVLMITSAILIVGIELEKRGKLFKNNYLLKIGDASYSIYLIHMTLQGLINWFCKLVGVNFLNPLLWIAGIFVIIEIGIWNYENFEKKIAKKLKPYLKEDFNPKTHHKYQAPAVI